jgi:molybdate transport system ATP-binding protein
MLEIDLKKKMLTGQGKAVLDIKTLIPEGKLVCLYGKSGAGKTTLLRMLAGLALPDNGKIAFENELWFDKQKRINLKTQKRNIGFMFQDYALFPNMSVEQNICFGQKKMDEHEVEKLLSAFELENLRGQKPIRLSGGQKQRCALARALAQKPRLLLLDEPLSSLDHEMRAELQTEIKKAHMLFSGITCMVSHDKQEILKLADLVLHIKDNTAQLLSVEEFKAAI